MTDLWTCPDCGRQFANLNQAHSCLTLTLDDVLEDASPLAIELYGAVEAALGDCGEFRVHPQKTRVAFITAMTFASVRLARRWVDLSLITAEPIEDERVSGVDLYGPTSFASEVRIRSVEEVDVDVSDWLCLAYQRGLQETLDPAATVEPVVGSTLQKLRVPFASRVMEVRLAALGTSPKGGGNSGAVRLAALGFLPQGGGNSGHLRFAALVSSPKRGCARLLPQDGRRPTSVCRYRDTPSSPLPHIRR